MLPAAHQPALFLIQAGMDTSFTYPPVLRSDIIFLFHSACVVFHYNDLFLYHKLPALPLFSQKFQPNDYLFH